MANEPHPKSQKQLHFHLIWNATKNRWYMFTFHHHFHPYWHWSQVIIAYVTTNRFLVVFTTTSYFYHGAMKDSHINSRKNGWFGHKLQTCGLVGTKLFVVFLQNIPPILHYMIILLVQRYLLLTAWKFI